MMMKKIRIRVITMALLPAIFLMGCGDDDVPAEENEEEVIDQVILTFTAAGDPKNDTVIDATDPDGEGAAPFNLQTIALAANETYTLSIELNNLNEEESITEEIKEEADEHQFFFGFTSGLFTDPEGDGNLGEDNSSDSVNYTDTDENANPLGLTTTWKTGEPASGEFTVVLKHQPDGQKTATSSSVIGETDVELTWDITIN